MSPAEPVDRRVRQALLGQLFAATPQPVAGGILFAGVVAIIVSAHAPAASAWGWFAVKAGIGIVRIVHARRFLGMQVETPAIGTWVRSYLFWIALDTLSWAAMLPLFGAGADVRSLTLLVCGLLGVASLGVFTTVSHWPLCVLYSSVCLGTVAAWFALRGLPGDWAVAVGSVIYLVLLVLESRRGNAHLAEMVRLRFENAALADERAAALEAAQASDTAKSRFLAMVSHEIRTPLNGILGMVQVLRGQQPDPRADHSLQVVENSARHLGRIIDDLLDLSRLDFSRMELQPAALNVRKVVTGVVEILEPLASRRGLEVAMRWHGDIPPWVIGDAARIGQVLHNLVGNALKFTNRGTVTLTVTAEAAGRLAIAVEDTGPGISEADQQRIFDAFERVGDVGLLPGTGLGLTIARRLAQAMDGDVTCESRLGQGSIFRFTFAAPTAPHGGPQVPLASGQTAGVQASAASPVLVVDDNEVNTLVARSMLDQLGVESDAAADGQQALTAMQQRRYAVVLMDCHMPVLDGWEATRRWRASETGDRLPIIGVTASAAPEDRQACLDAGMDEHLPKPYEQTALADLLMRFGRGQARFTPAPAQAPPADGPCGPEPQ
jgi:signal transduction histidine kinase/ActR/RegA family two-component response regulator